LHPRIWGRAIKVFLKGHGTGRPHGDMRQVPGIYLVRSGQIIWQYVSRNTADRPDYRTLEQDLQSALSVSS